MPPFREVLAEMDLYRRVIPFQVKDLELKNALLGSQRKLLLGLSMVVRYAGSRSREARHNLKEPYSLALYHSGQAYKPLEM